MAISMLKIRRPLGRLIFNMGIAIPGKTVFLIETPPWLPLHDAKVNATYIWHALQWHHIAGLVQERCNSSALALELHLSCTNPLIWSSSCLESPVTWRLIQQFVWANITGNIKTLPDWPFARGVHWIPLFCLTTTYTYYHWISIG